MLKSKGNGLQKSGIMLPFIIVVVDIFFGTSEAFIPSGRCTPFHSATKPLFEHSHINEPAPEIQELEEQQKVTNTDRKDELFGLFPLSEQHDREPRQIDDSEVASSWKDLLHPILADVRSLKDCVDDGARASISPKILQDHVIKVFSHLETTLNDLLGSDSKVDGATHKWITRRVREELQPLALLGPIMERFITKPRGYAGDFITIDWIYQNRPRGNAYLGRLLDENALSVAACAAVQSRRALITNEILKMVETTGSSEPVEITSMACGPARELHDLFFESPERNDIRCHLIDLDDGALSFVRDWCSDLSIDEQQVSLHNRNLLHLAIGKERLNTPQQDLVYAMGLIDYLNDKTVIRLLNYVFEKLKPGGRAIMGQFHRRNPTRGLMESVFEWKLIHRDENDMDRLFMASKFGCPCSEIIWDSKGVQMLACCTKIYIKARLHKSRK